MEHELREVKFYLTRKKIMSGTSCAYVSDYDKEFVEAMYLKLYNNLPIDGKREILCEMNNVIGSVTVDYINPYNIKIDMINEFMYKDLRTKNKRQDPTVIKILESIPKCKNPRLKSVMITDDQELQILEYESKNHTLNFNINININKK